MKTKVRIKCLMLNGSEHSDETILNFDNGDRNYANNDVVNNIIAYNTIDELIRKHPENKETLEWLLSHPELVDNTTFTEFEFVTSKYSENNESNTLKLRSTSESTMYECIIHNNEWSITIFKHSISSYQGNTIERDECTCVEKPLGIPTIHPVEVSYTIWDSRGVLVTEHTTNFEDGTSIGTFTASVVKLDNNSYMYNSERVIGNSELFDTDGARYSLSRIYTYHPQYDKWKLMSEKAVFQHDYENQPHNHHDGEIKLIEERLYEYIDE